MKISLAHVVAQAAKEVPWSLYVFPSIARHPFSPFAVVAIKVQPVGAAYQIITDEMFENTIFQSAKKLTKS